MGVKSKFSLVVLGALLVAVTYTSCRREIEDQPKFPLVEYFNPVQVKDGDILDIYGISLEGATVTIGGVNVEIESTTVLDIQNEYTLLKVIIPAGLSSGGELQTVSLTYSDGNTHTFAAPIAVRGVTAPNTLLLGDFDGGGIRRAVKTTDFTNGFWEVNAAGATLAGIDQNINNVPPSPANGNYAYAAIPASGILPNTFGFVGAIGTRSEVMNDGRTSWPVSFIDYPNSPITTETVPAQVFLQFYVNFNGFEKSQLRIYLFNTDMPDGERYAKTLNFGSPNFFSKGEDGWWWGRIQLSEFSDNFGFGSAITKEKLKEINKIQITITDNYNNIYPGGQIVDGVQVYMDHFILSVGTPIATPIGK